MIASITGIVTSIQDNKIYLAQNGFEFEIYSPHTQTFTSNQTITLYTYLYWNQEQGPSLYGFEKKLDKDVFLLIISCSGIGAKMGLSVLQQLDSLQFLHFIIEQNIDQLSNLKNIGTKKAEQLCLALRNKAPKLLKSHPNLAIQTPIRLWSDLQETLTSLNYSPAEIKQTTSILKDATANKKLTFDQLLRKALQILAK